LFNLTTAKALGIDVPLSLMLRADEMLVLDNECAIANKVIE
jgi:hypothetical protein